MTTPDLHIDCINRKFYGLYGKNHDTVEEIAEFIADQDAGSMLKFYRTHELGDEEVEKQVYIQKDKIISVRKIHKEYVKELEGEE